jgi:Zn-finger protein
MILMVDGAHHDEGHQKQKLHKKNRYEGISLVKNGSCAFYPCGDTIQNCGASN